MADDQNSSSRLRALFSRPVRLVRRVMGRAAALLFSRRADVLISAGHEGRTSGRLGAVGTGSNSELAWTPKVADAATRALRAAGISVLRVGADFPKGNRVRLALFIHFDHSHSACASGASIGYPSEASRAAADEWRAVYSRYWPFGWMPDNFTSNLSGYFGYGLVEAADASLVLELGELSCREQESWMETRLEHLGQIIAFFVAQRLGKGRVAAPLLPERAVDAP